MKRLVLACAALLIASLMPVGARAESFTGTWRISPSAKSGDVQLDLRYARNGSFGSEQWEESDDTPLSDLRGLSAADLGSNNQTKSFAVTDDAGEFRATGTFAGGSGAGTWTFVPSTTFAAELRRRGVVAPSDKQQFQLAMSRFKLATLDSLLSRGYERPSIDDLVAMGQHGVTSDYIGAMQSMRSVKTVSELIRMRDHGVSPKFVRALAAAGYGNVTSDDAVRLCDHGVSTKYLEGLRSLGYHPSVDDLVRLADHGVSIAFIERMRSHGYTHLSVDDLIRLRDHGF